MYRKKFLIKKNKTKENKKQEKILGFYAPKPPQKNKKQKITINPPTSFEFKWEKYEVTLIAPSV